MSLHCFLTSIISVEKLDIHLLVPSLRMVSICLAAFKIVYIFLVFISIFYDAGGGGGLIYPNWGS